MAAQPALPHPDRARRRRRRWPRIVGHGLVAARPRADGATAPASARSPPRGAIAVDGPTMFIWGTLLVLSLISVLLFAERHLEGGHHGVRRPGGGAPRHGGGARGVDPGTRAHRGLPADDVRGRRHDAVPRRQRPAHDVRRAGDPVAAALPALWAGPPPPAAQPGGGAEVLHARRVLLGLLPLRHRARSTATPAPCSFGDIAEAVSGPSARTALLLGGIGTARGRDAVQGRRGAVPCLDPGRLPGRARPR